MPLTVFGDEKATLVLKHDAKRTNPRTLLLNFLSYREMRGWQKRVDELLAMDDGKPEFEDKLKAILSEVVVGWKNISGEFSIDGIFDHYTSAEVVRILYQIPPAMLPSNEDSKN